MLSLISYDNYFALLDLIAYYIIEWIKLLDILEYEFSKILLTDVINSKIKSPCSYNINFLIPIKVVWIEFKILKGLDIAIWLKLENIPELTFIKLWLFCKLLILDLLFFVKK